MVATVAVCGEEAPPFQVQNGLCKGCTIAPTLFILCCNQLFSVGQVVVMQQGLRYYSRADYIAARIFEEVTAEFGLTL